MLRKREGLVDQVVAVRFTATPEGEGDLCANLYRAVGSAGGNGKPGMLHLQATKPTLSSEANQTDKLQKMKL